jgi:hypothetical protein
VAQAQAVVDFLGDVKALHVLGHGEGGSVVVLSRKLAWQVGVLWVCAPLCGCALRNTSA